MECFIEIIMELPLVENTQTNIVWTLVEMEVFILLIICCKFVYDENQ